MKSQKLQTPEPTATPSPTQTPEPTATPEPTPEPTDPPEPTPTPHVHSYKVESSTDATCSVEGSVVKVCECGDRKTEAVPATGQHNWVEEMQTITYPSTGHVETVRTQVGTTIRTEYACAVCDARFDSPEAKVEHCIATGDRDHAMARTIAYDFPEPIYEDTQQWVVDTPERTETVGTGRYTCTTCGATK